ncbi:MAG: transporter substrate-binding domain-containing protein [Desulfobacterales bacterium]
MLSFHFSATAYTEKEKDAVSLTAEEQAWINAHPIIRLAVDQHFEPRAYLDENGVLKGISVEFARLFEKKLGLNLELDGSTWKTALDRAFKYEVDGIMNVAELEERKLADINLRDAYTEIENLKNQLEDETAYLQEEIRLEHNFEGFIGQTPAIQYVLYKVEQVAATDTGVLVFGETGTGKELICRALEETNWRIAGPKGAAVILKLNPNTLRSRIRKLGIKKP